MIKKYKFTVLLSTLSMLLPMLIGLLLWDQLPESIPSHWDIHGNVDGWSSKPMAVFGLPGLLIGIHLLCCFASEWDPKKRNYHDAMYKLVLWLCPAISLICNGLVYSSALGYAMDTPVIMSLFFGVLMLVIGNMMPKLKQSYTMGIKLPWTLDNEENWNKTHRLAGKVWVGCSIVILATAFLGCFWILVGVMSVMILVPTVYSYCLYRKQKAGA